MTFHLLGELREGRRSTLGVCVYVCVFCFLNTMSPRLAWFPLSNPDRLELTTVLLSWPSEIGITNVSLQIQLELALNMTDYLWNCFSRRQHNRQDLGAAQAVGVPLREPNMVGSISLPELGTQTYSFTLR